MDKNKFPTAQVTINFVVSTVSGGDIDSLLQAEINPADNAGMSRFEFGGAAPRFRVYKSPNISQISFFPTAGGVSKVGGNIAESAIEEFITFSGASQDSEETENDSYRFSNADKPVYSYTVLDTFGNIGAVSLVEIGFAAFVCSKTSSGPTDPVVGVSRIRYTSRYDLYQLSGVTKPTGFGEGDFQQYPVIIYIVGIVS